MPETMVKTRFFHYRQTNSGGRFVRDDAVDVHVVVEALDAAHADVLAERIGVYFDGCATGNDCRCCGDRWSRCWNKGYEAPSIYDVPIEEVDWGSDYEREHGAYVYWLDGTKKHYGTPTPAR